MHRIALVALALLIVMLLSDRSDAGLVDRTHTCTVNSSGAGSCAGNMRGFRDSSDAHDYAQFTYGQSTATTFFQARVNGQSVLCQMGTGMTTQWLQATANPDIYFEISWTAGGTCYALTVHNLSTNL